MRMSPSARVTLALALGLVAGIALSGGALPHAMAGRIESALEPLGTLWLNALRMTILPLVVPLLIVGVAGTGDTRRTGRLGLSALALFYALLAALALAMVPLAPALFKSLTLDPASVASLRAGAHLTLPQAGDLSFRTWLVSLVPPNPVKAAADGAMLPVVVFTLIYSFALAHAAPENRLAQVAFFRNISEVMLKVVHGILWTAPAGVFAMAVSLGIHLRGSAVGALGYFVVVNVGVYLAVAALFYALAALAGRVPIGRFARASQAAQAVAFTTGSSLASLPAMLEGARESLRLPEPVKDFVLPLAVTIFKVGPPVHWPLGALFVATLYGIHFGAAQVATVAAASVLLNATIPGIPMGGLLVQAPLYAYVGLPLEGLGVLIAIDTLVDRFRTTLNVTADLAVAAVLGRPGPGPTPTAAGPVKAA